jgi:hypothetical protein
MRFNERLLHELGVSKADLATLRGMLDVTNGVGLNPISTTADITAFATGGQTNATELTSHINEIATVATGGDSVKLPAAVAGLSITILNNGVNACDVFPASGDNLGAGVDTAASLLAGEKITYDCYDSTNWS